MHRDGWPEDHSRTCVGIIIAERRESFKVEDKSRIRVAQKLPNRRSKDEVYNYVAWDGFTTNANGLIAQ